MIRVLELFAGSRSIGRAATELGCQVLSTDITAYEGIDIVGDLLALPTKAWVEFRPDIIWASPPCTGFSVASISHHWQGGKGAHIPRTSTAALGMALALRTQEIIRACKPAVWFMENPIGMLGVQKFMAPMGTPRRVHYCQYGDTRQKPTHIWTNCTTWTSRPPCAKGAPCHEAAPRGSKTGTQGRGNAHERAKIPHELCIEVINAAIAQIELGKPKLLHATSSAPPDPFREIIAEKKAARAPELFASA